PAVAGDGPTPGAARADGVPAADRPAPKVQHAGAAAAERGTGDIALVVTPGAVPEALAAACALAKVAVDAVPTVAGAVAVCRDPAGVAPREAATAISRLLREQTVLLLHRVSGQVSASRWSSGQEQGPVAPGLVLDGAPAEVDGLVLGTRS